MATIAVADPSSRSDSAALSAIEEIPVDSHYGWLLRIKHAASISADQRVVALHSDGAGEAHRSAWWPRRLLVRGVVTTRWR
jgi:hypothetical protein